MAKKNIRGDTPQKELDPLSPNDQMSDILLILDKMELLLQAVSEISKNGKHKTVPADKEHSNSFLKIDRYSSIVENFIKNLWSQLKDPTHFGLFSMKAKDFDKPENRQALEDLAAGRKSKAVDEFLKKYDITPKNHKEQIINNQKEEKMAKQDQQQAQGAESTQPKYRFNESMINWKQLELFGLSREFLQEKGLLDQMLRGYKTNQLVPISMNFGSAALRTDARLSFQQSIGGPVVLGIHGIRREPELDRPFYGHIFSEEDKQNLREKGNMGRVAELVSRTTGEFVPSFISIDKLTNEVVSMRVENTYIPNEIKDVVLTDQEKQDLRDGKAIYLEGMKAKSGNEFSAHVQISAERRGIDYLFDNDKVFNRQSLGGVELTEKQITDLNAGKAIFVEDMTRKSDGEKFSAFVKLDEASGRPAYTRYNPDSPEEAREIYVPKEMNGTTLTPEDREQLRAGKVVFLENMIGRRGEEFSSFVKLDLKTGVPSYSKTPDGFEERQGVKIPAELWGKTLTATQRAKLQDGKAVLVEGMTGYDGKTFSQYAKVSQNTGMINYFNENPDRKRDAPQRNVVAAQQQQQDKGAKQGKKQDKSKGVEM